MRRWAERRAWGAIGVLAGALTSACFEVPSYEGRTCSLDEPCPVGFVCTLDGRCLARGGPGAVDGGPASDGGGPGAGCTPANDAPPSGWVLTYHPLSEDGVLDLATCLGEEHLGGSDALAFSVASSTTAAGIRARDGGTFGVFGRARPTFLGASTFEVEHQGALRLRTGGIAIYDGSHTTGRATVRARGYAHGAESLAFELAATSTAAEVQVSWSDECSTIGAPGPTSWRARYYRVVVFGSDYRLDRTDCLGAEQLSGAELLRQWGASAPSPLLALGITERFGAVFFGPSRTFAASTRAAVYHDDGLRLFVDDAMIYEDWSSNQTAHVTVTVPAGTHDLTLEWFENRGAAGVSIEW